MVGERTGSSANDSMEEIKQFPFRKLCQRPSLTKLSQLAKTKLNKDGVVEVIVVAVRKSY